MKEFYTRREAIVAGLVGLAIAAIVWGPVLLRPFGYTPGIDLRTLPIAKEHRLTQPHPAVPPPRMAKGRPTGVVDINHADVAELQTLPGVGPTLARRIVEYRVANGSFQALDAIMEVDGIGPKRFEKLKPWIKAR